MLLELLIARLMAGDRVRDAQIVVKRTVDWKATVLGRPDELQTTTCTVAIEREWLMGCDDGDQGRLVD